MDGVDSKELEWLRVAYLEAFSPIIFMVENFFLQKYQRTLAMIWLIFQNFSQIENRKMSQNHRRLEERPFRKSESFYSKYQTIHIFPPLNNDGGKFLAPKMKLQL